MLRLFHPIKCFPNRTGFFFPVEERRDRRQSNYICMHELQQVSNYTYLSRTPEMGVIQCRPPPPPAKLNKKVRSTQYMKESLWYGVAISQEKWSEPNKSSFILQELLTQEHFFVISAANSRGTKRPKFFCFILWVGHTWHNRLYFCTSWHSSC